MTEWITQLTFLDIVDFILVGFLIYQVYLLIRGTIAIRIFLGVFILYAIWKGVEILQMKLLSEILGQFLGVGVLALIVVFQQEIRRFLLMLGNAKLMGNDSVFRKMFRSIGRNQTVEQVQTDQLASACRHLSKKRFGALIIVEREDDLTAYINSGLLLNAEVSMDLIENIFQKNAPLHDGAVIISKNRIAAARCILPISNSSEIPASYGMRHRAALGLSEQTDALVIVVSEETGRISTFCEGEHKSNVTKDNLNVHLTGIIDGSVF